MVLSAASPSTTEYLMEKIPAVVLSLEAGDTRQLAKFANQMTYPLAYASAGSHYKGPPAWEQVARGLAAAALVIFAIIGLLSCRHL